MKYGFRTPSFKRSLSAATKGAAKRALMREIVPYYGKRGMGWANPKKAAYNRVYNMTTANPIDILTDKGHHRDSQFSSNINTPQTTTSQRQNGIIFKNLPIWQRVLLVIGIIVGIVAFGFIVVALIDAIFPIIIAGLFLLSFLINGK